jgi:hypothetical protein
MPCLTSVDALSLSNGHVLNFHHLSVILITFPYYMKTLCAVNKYLLNFNKYVMTLNINI